MSQNYRETDDVCSGCGATAQDRTDNKPLEPQGLSDCPHCGAEKCCLCDTGDDVECGNCHNEADDDWTESNLMGASG